MPDKPDTYVVKITETAWGHMMEHARFFANVSVNAANKLVDDFLSKTESLEHMPERCPWLIHDTIPFQRYRKLFIGKYHLALFEIRARTVYVVAVVDCRQDYGWLIEALETEQ